jgi:hypothetical protein
MLWTLLNEQKQNSRRRTVAEPYAWQAVGGTIWNHKTSEDDTPLYTKQKWQGLTLEDIDDIGVSKDWIAGARWAEAKLREKNT